MLTQEHLKELLHYDPDTGIFTIKMKRGKCYIGNPTGVINHGYLRINIKNNRYEAARLAWLYVYGVWPKYHIDHIDHNPLNNRISNLRDVTRSGNQQNQIKAHTNNVSGLIGVTFHKLTGKFQSGIVVNNKKIHLGTFVTAQEAHEIYVKAKRIFHKTSTL